MLIDSHCHLDLSAFDGARTDVLRACMKANVHRLLVPGLDIQQFSGIVAMQQKYASEQANVYPKIDIALGLHPHFLAHLSDTEQNKQQQALLALAHVYKDKIVAIGECGLDASLAISMSYQSRILAQQIELAASLGKPLVLHHRQSHNQLIQLLKQHNFKFGGVIHAFSGSEHIANTYIDMGFMLGVGGTITYARAKKTRHTISQTSLAHLLLETDAPDMPIFGYQGEPNSPVRLPLIADALAELKQYDVAQVISSTTNNYNALFL